MAEVAKDPASHLLLVGVNHRSASAALRERLFAAEPDAAAVLEAVRAAGATEAVVLATCERIEALAVEADPSAAAPGLLAALARGVAVEPAEFEAHGYRLLGEDAVRHLFAVAASLDSQIVGEPQVLGQVKESHRRAAEAGLVGPALELLLQAAYGAAKRVRSETQLAEQPVTIAASALQVARDVHGDLTRRGALLVGLGEMGEFMAAELSDAGLGDLVIVHTSIARSEAVARRFGCNYRPWEDLQEALAGADIVVSALGTGRYSVTAAMAEAALKQRRREPIFFIDTAVPGDIDPAVAPLDGAFVYDLVDLERVARRGKANREAAAAAAGEILDQELATFLRDRAERSAAPSVTALRGHFESVRDDVLSDGRLSAEEATRRLVNRLLHDPSEVLRSTAAEESGQDGTQRGSLERALRRLFRIEGRGKRTSGKEDG
jgi:glutamyl-tRNA reductase